MGRPFLTGLEFLEYLPADQPVGNNCLVVHRSDKIRPGPVQYGGNTINISTWCQLGANLVPT